MRLQPRGAVSNLLGARLSFESGISKDNIFVYTIASPLTVYDRRAGFTDNIFNIVSEMDVVPRLPLRYWGLRRYGTDLWLPAGRGAAPMNMTGCSKPCAPALRR